MTLFLFLIGVLLFVLGMGYLFQPRMILRFNAICRDTFFRDSVVLLNNRRVGILLLLVSFILIALTRRAP